MEIKGNVGMLNVVARGQDIDLLLEAQDCEPRSTGCRWLRSKVAEEGEDDKEVRRLKATVELPF